MPLIHAGRPAGVLKVYSAEPAKVGADEARVLGLLGNVIGAGLARAELFATMTELAVTDALAGHGLTLGDVTHVFVTHHHMDHTRKVGMFPTARVVDVDSVYDGSLWLDHNGDGHHLSADV